MKDRTSFFARSAQSGCRPEKLIALGLDGLPLDLALKLAEKGFIPHLARLLPQAGTIMSELPELSPVNWTSFYTAAGPEEHGIFGFTRIHAQSYEFGLANSACVAAPSIFERLGERGFYSRVINLPNTWPARPFKGMLVAGFVAEDFERAVYPPFLRGVMAGYKLEADTSRAVAEPSFLLSELRDCLASRRRAFRLLWPDQAWDLLVLTLTETDRLFHFLWTAILDEKHPLHPEIKAFFRDWDELAGEVAASASALGARLLVLADHGFTRLITEVDLNVWLRERGYLKQRSTPEASPELDGSVILPETEAFALDPGRIYMHSAARFANGRLDESEAEKICGQIRDELLNLKFEGQRVLADIKPGQELYNGPLGLYAPDLVCVPAGGFDLKAKFNRNKIFGFYGRDGAHTPDGAIFYDSHGEKPSRLRDAGKIILNHFGAEKM